jgi:hypothetical protein
MLDICDWNLITVTYDGSEVCLYYNGKLNIKANASGTPTITSGNLLIGLTGDKKLYFNGMMDDLRIYSRAISSQEVKDLYNADYESNPTFLEEKEGIVAQYAFEDNYEDSSEYKNNGELLSESDSVAFVPAIVGKGIRLGDGNYIEVPDNNYLNVDKGFSISTWMYKEEGAPMPLLQRLNSSMSSDSNSMDYNIVLWEDKMDFGYQPFINANGCLMIGTDRKKFFSGILDELKIYNYALTADEVKAEYITQDTLFISKDNQTKIKSLKAKATLNLAVNRKYIATGKSEKITKGVTFKSSNSKIFTVSKTGKITTVKKGTATLTISHGGISTSYKITVN